MTHLGFTPRPPITSMWIRTDLGRWSIDLEGRNATLFDAETGAVVIRLDEVLNVRGAFGSLSDRWTDLSFELFTGEFVAGGAISRIAFADPPPLRERGR